MHHFEFQRFKQKFYLVANLIPFVFKAYVHLNERSKDVCSLNRTFERGIASLTAGGFHEDPVINRETTTKIIY